MQRNDITWGDAALAALTLVVLGGAALFAGVLMWHLFPWSAIAIGGFVTLAAIAKRWILPGLGDRW